MQAMVDEGFDLCQAPPRQVHFEDGGSPGQHCAPREPATRADPRIAYLEETIGTAKVALL